MTTNKSQWLIGELHPSSPTNTGHPVATEATTHSSTSMDGAVNEHRVVRWGVPQKKWPKRCQQQCLLGGRYDFFLFLATFFIYFYTRETDSSLLFGPLVLFLIIISFLTNVFWFSCFNSTGQHQHDEPSMRFSSNYSFYFYFLDLNKDDNDRYAVEDSSCMFIFLFFMPPSLRLSSWQEG